MAKDPISQVVLEETRARAYVLLGGTGGRAIFRGEKTVAAVTQELARRSARVLPWSTGLIPASMPLRAIHTANDRLVYLAEYPPGIRTMPWIRENSPVDFGPGATYHDVTLSLPFVLFFVTVSSEGVLLPSSVYFRTEPLRNREWTDELFDCHFLNCSPDACGVYCWMCSQYMQSRAFPKQSLPEFVAATIERFWLAASNRSSERHEGQSFFGKGTSRPYALRDYRVRSVCAWEQATRQHPLFALEVPWNPARRTVADVFCELTQWKGAWPYTTSQSVSAFILSNTKGESA